MVSKFDYDNTGGVRDYEVLLWLDDYRDPFDTDTDWLIFSPIGRDVEVHWVKSYNEFVEWIQTNGLPNGICFDHDLDPEHYAPEEVWGEGYQDWVKAQNFKEKTGYDCAQWLIDYCLDQEEKLPRWNSQSANPPGRENINKLLGNFLKFQARDDNF